MSDIDFARPWMLAALALPVLALAAVMFGHVRATRAGRVLSRQRPSAGSLFWPAALCVAVAAGIVAAAQPQWGTQSSAIPRKGAELVVVLDISRSMDAADAQPSRLEAAKAAIIETLNRIGGDRAGLVVFAGTANLRFPLTSDLNAARQVVSSLETGQIFVEGGTNAGAGLDVALSAFELERPAGRVVLLITDGDDLVGDTTSALEALRDAGVELLVAGAGTTDGATVPFFDEERKEIVPKPDASGQPIHSRLGEDFLKAIAIGGGGRYLGNDLSVVPGQVQGVLSARQQAIVDERAATFPVDRYHWFAGAAIAIVVLATLAERVRASLLARPALMAAVVATAVFFAGCASRGYELNDDALEAYERGDYDRAIELFTEASAEQPGDSQVLLNLALAYDAAERHEEARQTARRALLSRDDRLRAQAHQIIGHQEFSSQRLPESLESFRQALMLDPANDGVRHDYEVVLRLLLQEQEEAPGEGEPGQGNDGQEGDPNASPTPGTGEPGDPGQQGEPGQEGQEGDPSEDPSGDPGQSGDPQGSTDQGQGGGPRDPDAIDDAIKDIDGQIASLVREAGERPTAEEANRILALLRERERLAAIRNSLNDSTDPGDY